MDVLFPILLVLVFVYLGSIVYRMTLKGLFRRSNLSPESVLPEEQVARYGHYQNAIPLQLAVNLWHNKAIRAKTLYELVGVSICAAGPALILLSAGLPYLERTGLASETGRRVAEFVVCIGVLLILVGFRHPNRKHVHFRLRSELLRSHLHCLLAKVGPYCQSESKSTAILGTIDGLSQDEIESQLRALEEQCNEQSLCQSTSGIPDLSLEQAHAYLIERVGEQAGDSFKPGYFQRVNERFSTAFRMSARLVIFAVVCASLVGLWRIISPRTQDLDIADFWYSCFGALAVFLVGARAIMGWDAKAGLYNRQSEMLTLLAEELVKDISAFAKPTPEALLSFHRHAARFESLMAREAIDWKLITDRESFDVTP